MAPKKKKITPDQLLEKKGATPAEGRIYKIILDFFEGNQKPITSGQIVEVYGTQRTNIRWHLLSLIEKGLVKKKSHKFYVPVRP